MALTVAALFVAGEATAGANAKRTMITCHASLVNQHNPTSSGPGEDFGFVNCSQPFGRGLQYDTFKVMPKTSTTGTAVLKFKAFFDRGTVSGVWRATYRYTSSTMALFAQKVTWIRGTGAFTNVRATGIGTGVQSATRGTINQTLTVTGL